MSEPSEPLRAYLSETRQAMLHTYVDPSHFTYLELYLARADARAALGDAPAEIAQELIGATRCWAANATLYLERWPAHRVKSRRLVPLQLAIATGDGPSIANIQTAVGVDVFTLLAGMEPDAITAEVAALCDGFTTPRLREPVDLAGFAAVLWWAALSAVLEGNATALAAVGAHGSATLEGAAALVDGATGGVARMRAVVRGVIALADRDADGLRAATADHADRYAGEQTPSAEAVHPAVGSLDLTSLAMHACGVAVGMPPAELVPRAGAGVFLASWLSEGEA